MSGQLDKKTSSGYPDNMDLDELLIVWQNYLMRRWWEQARTEAATRNDLAEFQKAERALAALPEISALDGLRANAELVNRLNVQRWIAMQAAREQGVSLAQIGQALGVSRQSAWEFMQRRLAAQQHAARPELNEEGASMSNGSTEEGQALPPQMTSNATTSLPQNRFTEAYQAQAPWDIGRPQGAFVKAADQIQGNVIDLGCGTGEHALFFAQRGHQVTGVDFVAEAIAQAKAKAEERGLDVTFLVQDALVLEAFDQPFDSAIDSGLFHVFSDAERLRYVDSVARALKPGGRLFLLCFSDQVPPGVGPRRVSQAEIRAAFATGWQVESIQETYFELASHRAFLFPQGGPQAWFCVIQRTA